jgi:hypothetical protein
MHTLVFLASVEEFLNRQLVKANDAVDELSICSALWGKTISEIESLIYNF